MSRKMRFFLIAGEASGDLHGSHLMQALLSLCPEAEFRYYGGDKMQAVGGTLLCHYKELAYMGFVQVALHLRTILRGMARCKQQIDEWHPDAVILIDYPGFNLKIARYVKEHKICPVFYYISPKIWAWKEHRIHNIRRDVDHLFSILPFEIPFFEGKHHYPITYVGNPTLDEVAAYQKQHGNPQPDGQTIALLPGSRRQEIADNLSRMLQAATPFSHYRVVIAMAPAIEEDFYHSIISRTDIDSQRVSLVTNKTYHLLSHATLALVTSGTATLETALFGVPQVVCYYMRAGWFVSRVRPYFLKVPFISLVNLIAEREVVPELVASDMNVNTLTQHIKALLPTNAEARIAQLRGYEDIKHRLGQPGAPLNAAQGIMKRIEKQT